MATETNQVATPALGQLDVMECPIAKLADEDLTAIFKHLPPYERLIVSQVCQNWRDIGQTPWRDVTHLDLRSVPTANILAVIRKCPNLRSVSALRQNLGDFIRFASRLNRLTSLKCVDCTFTIDTAVRHPPGVAEALLAIAWKELIWHDSKATLIEAGAPTRQYPLPYNRHTFRRLQLSALSLGRVEYRDIEYAVQQPLMEGFILGDVGFTDDSFRRLTFTAFLYSALAKLANLREVYLDSPNLTWLPQLTSTLPELKIVYLRNVNIEEMNVSVRYPRNNVEETNFISSVILQNLTLSILVITASRVSDFNGEVLIPARKLFPNGFNAQPVPQLHLFLGKTAAERLRFHPSPTDALKIYPIDAPLPEFLEKEEIKPIFEDSWIASRITEGARDGAILADHSFEGNAESISYVQE